MKALPVCWKLLKLSCQSKEHVSEGQCQQVENYGTNESDSHIYSGSKIMTNIIKDLANFVKL